MPDSPATQHCLDRRFYVDDALFEWEREHLHAADWYCAGSLDAVAEPGGVAPVDVAGRDVLVTRAADGRVRAFFNVCRHRGCRLVDSSLSDQTVIQCPYHGWTYRLDGALSAAPNMSAGDALDLSQFGLRELHVSTWAQQIFVRTTAGDLSLSEKLLPLVQLTENWPLDEMRVAHRLEYDIQANWKLLFENFSECYHCRFVHPRLNQLTRFDSASNDLTDGPILGGPMLLNEGSESMSQDGHACGTPFSGLSDEQRRRVYYFTVFPNLFFSPHPDYVLIHRLYPLAADRTRIECDFLFAREDVTRAGFSPRRAVDFWDEVNRQDWQMCERTQAGMKSGGYLPGPLSSMESMVAAFDRHYLSRLDRRWLTPGRSEQ